MRHAIVLLTLLPLVGCATRPEAVESTLIPISATCTDGRITSITFATVGEEVWRVGLDHEKHCGKGI